jgi:hypothetical protein
LHAVELTLMEKPAAHTAHFLASFSYGCEQFSTVGAMHEPGPVLGVALEVGSG